jgi:hypothetical protein
VKNVDFKVPKKFPHELRIKGVGFELYVIGVEKNTLLIKNGSDHFFTLF